MNQPVMVTRMRNISRGLLAGLLGLGVPVSVMAAETESAIARGARIYDKYCAESKAEKPATDHAAYPHKGGKYGKDASWRCKKRHGWDYMDKYIGRSAKKARGDAGKGEVYFNTLCAGCHGVDGKKIKDADPLSAAAGNPWEVLHKVLNGHPGELESTTAARYWQH